MRPYHHYLAAACTAALLLSCAAAGPRPAAGPAEARTLAALEQGCLLDPARPQNWQGLGEMLEKMGQGDRAARMLRQAETLRRHDAGADYALLRAAAAGDAAAGAIAHIELLQRGDGLIELRRVGAAAMPSEAPLRVEIRNGNGVRGMAASLARKVGGGRLRVVRLANQTPFTVARSRIEYRAGLEPAAKALASRLGPFAVTEDGHCRAADLCLVLGRDLRDPAAYSQLMPPMPLLSATRLGGLP
jgi:hypothetical protein